MRIGRRWASGLFAASLLLPVPALAITRTAGSGKVTSRQVTQPSGRVTATDLVLHQSQERRTFLAFARALRTEFRRTDNVTRASVERVIRDTLLDLRAHWAFETRTKTVTSSFDFPDL
jgi:hypothetical protein